MNVREYIRENWKNTIRIKGSLNGALDLPYKYTSPCAKGMFDDLYYWDTYFINKGLMIDGYDDIALNNIRDFCFIIDKYGFMLNSANESMTNRSQVPLFIKMCDEYLNKHYSLDLLKELFPYMVKEYDFWMKNRSFDNGLNHYGNSASKEFKEFFYDEFKNRVHLVVNEDLTKEEVGNHALSECESGWDFSNRFHQRCADFAPVDLNSIMYENEMILSKYASVLNIQNNYEEIASNRKKEMLLKMEKDGILFDYDMKNGKVNEFVTVASLVPYFCSVVNDEHNFDKALSKLIYNNRLAATEKNDNVVNYQWNYPNMWPNLVFFAFEGARKIKDEKAMKLIGDGYLSTVELEFDITSCLWEKYDVNTGRKSSKNEYQETEMMGWTAAAYACIYEVLYGRNK